MASVAVLLAAALLMMTAARVEADELTPDQVKNLTFSQRLGDQVPLDLSFRDEHGQAVTLGNYFAQTPVLLTLNYFHCPNLCPLELQGLFSGLSGVSFTLGQQFSVISVSIDPREGPPDAMATKLRVLRDYRAPEQGGGWHLLTGPQAVIDRLTQAVGFEYAYDADNDEYAHPLGVLALTPSGQISRYIYGFDFGANDLRLALVDASSGRIGSVLDRAVLICYRYDPLTGRYTPVAMDLMRGGGAVGILGTLMLLGWLWRGEFHRRRSPIDTSL